MKWFDDWIEVFKAGTHTDSAGNERTWTQQDLDAIVANYEASDEDAPLVLGHPKTDDPAYGWVDGLKRNGDVLLAKVKKLCPEFVNWVEKGLYRKISIALTSDLNLRHIGFLGAATPAVKGLKNAFCEYQFAPEILAKPSGLIPSFQKGTHVESLNQAHADLGGHPKNIAPVEFVNKFLRRLRPIPTTKLNACFSGYSKNNKEKNMFKKATTAEFSAKIEQLETELEFARKSTHLKEKSDFLTNLQKEAKITAEDKIRLERIFDFLLQADMEFAQGDESISFCAELEQVLVNLPQRVQLCELANRKSAPKGTYSTPQEELGLKIAQSIKA